MLSEYSMQSFANGLAAMLLLGAVIAACTLGKALLKRYIRKSSRKENNHVDQAGR